MGALGGLAWGALVSLGLYEGYAELVLAMVIFGPVGAVFLLHGLGIFYAVALRWQAALRNESEGGAAATIGSVMVIGGLFLASGLFFVSLSVNAILAISAR